MILSDFHCHSTFCDGKDTPEDMVLSAIDKGLSSFGICIHSYTPFDDGYCAKPDDYKKFISEMAELKEKYADKITLYCGIEQDFYSKDYGEKFDYIIGSVHYIKIADEYFPLDLSKDAFVKLCEGKFGGDYTLLSKAYFEILSQVKDKTNADIIGHFDLITKYNEGFCLFREDDEKYLEYGYKCIDALSKIDAVFEINTGAISRGHRKSPYPSNAFLNKMVSNGAKLILSSDAHAKENIAFWFDNIDKESIRKNLIFKI